MAVYVENILSRGYFTVRNDHEANTITRFLVWIPRFQRSGSLFCYSPGPAYRAVDCAPLVLSPRPKRARYFSTGQRLTIANPYRFDDRCPDTFIEYLAWIYKIFNLRYRKA